MKRRFFLFAAPAIITTPGLLMAIKPFNPDALYGPYAGSAPNFWDGHAAPARGITLRDWQYMLRYANLDVTPATCGGFSVHHNAPIAQPSAA